MSHVASTAVLTHITRDPDKEADERPFDMALARRMAQCAAPYKSTAWTLVALVVMRAIQLPLIAGLTGHIIQGPIAERNWRLILYYTGGYVLLVLFALGVMYFRQLRALLLGEWVVHDLRQEMFEHLHRMPMSFFHQMKLGRLISRMVSDTEALRIGVQEVLFVSIVGLGQMLMAAALMAYIDPVLFSIVLGMAPVLYLINRAFAGKLTRVHRAIHESFSRVTATLAESVTGIRVTQGFVRQDVNAEMFNELVEQHSQKNMESAMTRAVFSPLLDLNSQCFLAVLLLIGGYRVMLDKAEIGQLIMFFFLANVFFNQIRPLSQEYAQALNAMAGAERVFKLLDQQPAWSEPPADQLVDLRPIKGQVVFRDLSFGYDPARLVLKNVDIVVQPGQTVALVGHTGSGKSSIINLIAKFYLPTSGHLLIDGVEIRQLRGDTLHQQMGIVLQVNFLFTGTVKDNIRVGKPGATDDEVREAARKIDVLDLLESLPEGLDTSVGERGSSLSLGQRQIICFTRAMLADPRILILDEATSSVDAITEARIQRALTLLLQNRTSFVVAHRLSTIRHADMVLVLDHGRIVERGSHNQLLMVGGVYANLYRQFVRASQD